VDNTNGMKTTSEIEADIPMGTTQCPLRFRSSIALLRWLSSPAGIGVMAVMRFNLLFALGFKDST